MTKNRIQVLYEHGGDYRPFSSSYIRLLRPLCHPEVSDDFEITFTPILLNQPTDFVFLDRLWTNPAIEIAESLINKIKALGAKVILFTDDDLASKDILSEWHTPKAAQLFQFFIQSAFLVVVSTDHLKNTLSIYKTPCEVIPNYLDERLLVQNKSFCFKQNRFIVGYMGTPTHNEDLWPILPALIEFQNNRKNVIFEFVGVHNNSEFPKTINEKGLKGRFISPTINENEYPLFMLWWTTSIAWDLAIAPLKDNDFNRNKSDIKLLDYSAIGTPGIYSNIFGYQSTVPTRGLLVDNSPKSWLSALDQLYEEKELRDTFAENAKNYLWSERILQKGIKKYNNLLNNL